MSFTVQDVIDGVRSVHPAFSRYMVPDKAIADFCTREQRRLITKGTERDRSFLAQPMTILFDLAHADADAPGEAGVGTSGGVPAEATDSGFAAVQEMTGSALAFGEGTVLVSDTPVASATATTLTAVGSPGWTVNAYTNKIAKIVAGTGAGSTPRTIASNTASQLTASSAWEITPDTSSVFRVTNDPTQVDETIGMVTDLPAVSARRGFLVKLNASGQPYLDVTAPIVGYVSRGIPLPPYVAVLGGQVRFTNASPQSDYGALPLSLLHAKQRFHSLPVFAAYIEHQSLYLIGGRAEWGPVSSIELSYIPVAPAFAARTDVFLLPDTALPALVASAALFAASRITGIPDVPQPPSDLLAAQAADAHQDFLSTIGLTKRARIGRVRPGF